MSTEEDGAVHSPSVDPDALVGSARLVGLLSPERHSYRDVAGLTSFDVPVGWAYDPVNSSTAGVFFVPWNRPNERLYVELRPAACPASGDDESWYRALEEANAFGPTVSVKHFRSRGRACLSGFNQGTSRVIVRGSEIDASIEHRRHDDELSSVTDGMKRVLDSLQLAEGVPHERPAGPDEIFGQLEHLWTAATSVKVV